MSLGPASGAAASGGSVSRNDLQRVPDLIRMSCGFITVLMTCLRDIQP